MFVFERFWIFFRLFNLCGIFPWYKESIDGEDHLRPCNAALQFIKYLIFVGILYVAPCSLIFIFNISWEDLMSVSFDFQSNETNKVTYIILLICFLFLHILSIISMFRIRKDLCDLQDFLNSRFTLNGFRIL